MFLSVMTRTGTGRLGHWCLYKRNMDRCPLLALFLCSFNNGDIGNIELLADKLIGETNDDE